LIFQSLGINKYLLRTKLCSNFFAARKIFGRFQITLVGEKKDFLFQARFSFFGVWDSQGGSYTNFFPLRYDAMKPFRNLLAWSVETVSQCKVCNV
jgi:hypothetical protein